MKIRLFNKKRRKRPDVEDMVWAIKMLTMDDKKVERMINNFRNTVLEFNKPMTMGDRIEKTESMAKILFYGFPE